MQSTPQAPPFAERDDNELVEELCLALRDVGVRAYSLPDDERTKAKIIDVQEIHSILQMRRVGIEARLERLSSETSWQMEDLLRDCLAYPSVVPYVKAFDGVRIPFRCYLCEKKEFPNRDHIWFCDDCLEEAIKSIESKIPLKGLLLMRLYNREYWCEHSNAETLVLAFDDYEPIHDCYCKQCLTEEQIRRNSLG